MAKYNGKVFAPMSTKVMGTQKRALAIEIPRTHPQETNATTPQRGASRPLVLSTARSHPQEKKITTGKKDKDVQEMLMSTWGYSDGGYSGNYSR